MHQLTRINIATANPTFVVYPATPKNIKATVALVIANKDMSIKIVLRIFVILNAVSTLVCTSK
jgi:hypothetical protein